MNIILWIVTIFLAAGFLAGGVAMLVLSKERFRNAFDGWRYADDFPDGFLKVIGVMKVLAAAGLILPAALDIDPVLVPLAALGLVLLMVGAAITHARRKENQAIVINLVFIVLAGVVVWGRFGPYS